MGPAARRRRRPFAGAGSGSLLPEPGLLVSAWSYFTVQLNEAVPVTAFASLALTLTE